MSRTRKPSPRRKRLARKLRLAWRELLAAFRIEARDLRERRAGGGPAGGRTTTERLRRGGAGKTRCVDCHRFYGPEDESPWPNVCAPCISASRGGGGGSDPEDQGSDPQEDESDHEEEAADEGSDPAPAGPTPSDP